MHRSLSLVAACALVSVTSLAAAGTAPPTPRFRPHSDAAIDLFNGSILGLYNTVNGGPCPAPLVRQHLTALAAIERAQATLGDASDAAAVADWTKQMRGFLEDHRGVPGIGDWAAVDAVVATARARARFTMPDDLTQDAALTAVIDRAVTARADADRLGQIASHVQVKLYNCDDRGAGALLPGLQAEVSTLDVAVFGIAERLTYDRFEPLLNDVKRMAELDVTTWDGHARWVRMAIDQLAAARALVAMEARLVALDEFTGAAPTKGAPDPRTRPTAVLAVAKQLVTELPPLIAQRLPEVAFPRVTAKDRARDKVVANFLAAGDAVVFGPRYYPKNTTQSYDEDDPVDHLRHAVVRQVGNGYVAVKPATWTRAVPDGVAPSALCELRWFNFFKYSKSGPGHTRNTWLVNVESPHLTYVGPILCTQAKRVTKLAM